MKKLVSRGILIDMLPIMHVYGGSLWRVMVFFVALNNTRLRYLSKHLLNLSKLTPNCKAVIVVSTDIHSCWSDRSVFAIFSFDLSV